MLRRIGLSLVLSAVAIGALAGAVSADPVHAKNSLVIPATCGGQPVMAAVNGNGEFTPAHVVGTTSVFIPQAFNLTFEFTPTGGQMQTMTDTASHHHTHRHLVTCTINFTQPNAGGTLHLFGTVRGFFTPAK
jgi:hypothetical protein